MKLKLKSSIVTITIRNTFLKNFFLHFLTLFQCTLALQFIKAQNLSKYVVFYNIKMDIK
jgi:hypothetical protein